MKIVSQFVGALGHFKLKRLLHIVSRLPSCCGPCYEITGFTSRSLFTESESVRPSPDIELKITMTQNQEKYH